MNKTIYVLNSCDEWKSWDSMRVLGIFDDEEILKANIKQSFLDNNANWQGRNIKDIDDEELDDVLDEISNADASNINDYLEYLYIEYFRLNELGR
jgi:hypothetical protein